MGKPREIAKKAVIRLIGNRRYAHLLYRRHYRRLMRLNGIPNRRAEGEEAYRTQWKRLSRWVDPYSYRLFSHFCGPTPDIIPEDILHTVVEARLNPPEEWAVYEDKNNFVRYAGADFLPPTVAWRQGGGEVHWSLPLSEEMNPLILKPSVGTSCGEGIIRFDREGEHFVASDGRVLDNDYLLAYGNDWVLQECVAQHPILAQFNPSSVNTLRIAVYRSVIDLQPHVTAAVLRIGARGAIVDNAAAGGRFVGINIQSGQLSHCTMTEHGEAQTDWNGIDFEKNSFTVPGWEAAKELVCRVAENLGPHHLIAFDIAIDANEKPMLIEYNIGGFSPYFFHFTGQTLLGPWTDEAVAWCCR